MLFCYELTRKILAGYDQVCGELCKELELPRISFDILLFLANNPGCDTARDIVELRHLKANLVSIHLERLEEEGYLTRTAVAGDRRKRALCLTEKAAPIVAAGREMQQRFFDRLEENIAPGAKSVFLQTLETMNQNMDRLLEEKK